MTLFYSKFEKRPWQEATARLVIIHTWSWEEGEEATVVVERESMRELVEGGGR